MESGRIIEVASDEYVDPFAGRTIPEMKEADTCETGRITKVEPVMKEGRLDGYSLGYDSDEGGSYGLGIYRDKCGDKLDAVEPKVGSEIRVYSKGLGHEFHGVDIDDIEAFWQTPLERDADRVVWLADHDRRRREEFVEMKEQLDAHYEALPEPLKGRIAFFREREPDFRIESEPYELFCCTEAAKFVARAEAAAEAGTNRDEVEAFFADDARKGDKVWDIDLPDSPAAAWLLWAWAIEPDENKRQQKLLDYSSDHTGNTFGGAMRLALGVLRNEPLVPDAEPAPA